MRIPNVGVRVGVGSVEFQLYDADGKIILFLLYDGNECTCNTVLSLNSTGAVSAWHPRITFDTPDFLVAC